MREEKKRGIEASDPFSKFKVSPGVKAIDLKNIIKVSILQSFKKILCAQMAPLIMKNFWLSSRLILLARRALSSYPIFSAQKKYFIHL